jgi:hypothetical protein
MQPPVLAGYRPRAKLQQSCDACKSHPSIRADRPLAAKKLADSSLFASVVGKHRRVRCDRDSVSDACLKCRERGIRCVTSPPAGRKPRVGKRIKEALYVSLRARARVVQAWHDGPAFTDSCAALTAGRLSHRFRSPFPRPRQRRDCPWVKSREPCARIWSKVSVSAGGARSPVVVHLWVRQSISRRLHTRCPSSAGTSFSYGSRMLGVASNS